MNGYQSIVLDTGSAWIRGGFSGLERPKTVQNLIGEPKYLRVMPGGALEGAAYCVGPKIDQHRGSMVLRRPMDRSVPQSWEDMERVWAYMYSKEQLNVSSADFPVLMTEPALHPLAVRLRTAHIFFEQFNTPALYFAIQSVLSLYASGRTTGIVLDVGDGSAHCVPVYEGYALSHAVSRTDVAGRDVTQHLQLLLRRAGCPMVSSAEFEVVREMKENCSYVLSEAESRNRGPPVDYRLPDDSVVRLHNEPWLAPEILFQPTIIGSESMGVQDCLVKSIMKSDVDMRKTLFSQIVLSGGSTQLVGFGERLLNELRRNKATPKETKIRIAAPPDRQLSPWLGGSILSSLSTFRNMWITKRDFEEQGDRVFMSAL